MDALRLLSGEELRCPSAAMERVLSCFCSSDETGSENVVVLSQMMVYHLRCCSEQLGHAHGFGIHRGSVIYIHQYSDSRDGQFKGA